MDTTVTPSRQALEIDAARNLPALPAAVLELLDMLGRDDVETHALAAKISLDPALAAKTLRLANSSFYGMARHVTSLSEAASVLGLRTVRTVVTTAALTGSIAAPVCEGFDFNAFWRHAVSAAVGSKLVAIATGVDSEAAFTAGLLHDIGRLVLAAGFPQRYEEVLAHGDARGIELGDREHQLLGIDHAAVGALVAEHWRFPKPIVDAIAGHHALPTGADAVTLTQVVHLADHLLHALELGTCVDNDLPASCLPAWLSTHLSAECRMHLLVETELQAGAICAALLH